MSLSSLHLIEGKGMYAIYYSTIVDQYYPEGHVTQGGGRLPRDTCHSRGQWLTGLL